MKKISYVEEDQLYNEAKKKINLVNSILDVGCGIRPQNLTAPYIHVCIDAHKQYLDIVEQNNKKLPLKVRAKFVLINKTTDWIISNLSKKIVDTIFLLDVIEHLDKKHGLDLIESFTKIARHQIIIFTPLGFIRQEHPDGKDAWGLDGGKWQEHRSGWTPNDFDDTWEFVICRDFHKNDNMGNEHNDPIGAFFAIKTMGSPPQLISKKDFFTKALFTIRSLIKYNRLTKD
jgi:hypothetical protein